jgi:hypothetical protein
MRSRLTAIVASAAAAITVAVATPARAEELYVGAGTTGFELGAAIKLAPHAGLRIDAEFLNLGRTFERDGATYDAKLKFANLGVYGDVFVTDSFRLVGGLLLGSRKVSGVGVATGGTYTINGTTYPAAGESMTLDAKFPSASPYFGIGFGHSQSAPGLGLYFDAGVAFGRAKVKLTPSAGLLAAAGQANIDAEQARMQDDLDKLRAYPVVKFGLNYAF